MVNKTKIRNIHKKIVRYGTSYGVVISSVVIKSLKLKIGDTVSLSITKVEEE